MKPSNSNPKLTQYDHYRTRAKSELNNCSGLLSGLNQLEVQMKEYQQKREMKGSQSQLEITLNIGSGDKNQNGKEKGVGKYSEAKTERINNSQLTTIAQFNPKAKPSKPGNIMTNSTVSLKTPKGKSQVQKMLFSKTVNAHSKEKDPKKQRQAEVKNKAKELQQEMLELFSSEPYKKNIVNKEFAALLKLLD